ERKLQITRRCLEVLAEFRNPVCIITKNHLVTRDIDVLQELAKYDAVSVNLSVTTLDPALANIMEPRASIPPRRIEAVEALAKANATTRDGACGTAAKGSSPSSSTPSSTSPAASCVSTRSAATCLRARSGVPPRRGRYGEDHLRRKESRGARARRMGIRRAQE